MPLDPNIILSGTRDAGAGIDVNALLQQQMQGMANINTLERQRRADAQDAQAAQEAAAVKALSPALAAAFSDPSDDGLAAAFNMVPPQYRAQAQEQMAQLQAIPNVEMRKNVLRSGLAQYDFGRTILAQLEPTANMRLQADTASSAQALQRRRLELDEKRLETEAAGGKIAQWVTDDAGNVTGLDARGNIVATQPGIGKKTVSPTGAKINPQEAKFKVDETLSELLASYNKLKKDDAIVSTKNSAIGNIVARTGAALGTTVGRAVGTNAQTERDYIQNLRTDLIRDIKLATGMSSQEINSNFELQAALDSLGDPYSQSFETAVRTIQKLSRKYGLGGINPDNADVPDSGDGSDAGEVDEANPLLSGK